MTMLIEFEVIKCGDFVVELHLNDTTSKSKHNSSNIYLRLYKLECTLEPGELSPLQTSVRQA